MRCIMLICPHAEGWSGLANDARSMRERDGVVIVTDRQED